MTLSTKIWPQFPEPEDLDSGYAERLAGHLYADRPSRYIRDHDVESELDNLMLERSMGRRVTSTPEGWL